MQKSQDVELVGNVEIVVGQVEKRTLGFGVVLESCLREWQFD